ncbi:MAG: sulfotransferase [Nitrososphaeraceae archaeon]
MPEWVVSVEAYEADGEMKLHLNVESGVTPADINALSDELAEELTSLFSRPVQPFRTRVFCIGWPKTGTTSLTEALHILGLFSWHSAPWVLGFSHFRSDASQIQIDFTSIAEYTAVSALPICVLRAIYLTGLTPTGCVATWRRVARRWWGLWSPPARPA